MNIGPAPQQQDALSKNSASRPSRRDFIGHGAAMASLAYFGVEFAFPGAMLGQSTLSPDAALQTLIDGNKRFASGTPTVHVHDLEILRQHTAEKQEPFAAVLSCADSRVPVELIFDQSIGQIFVTRVAGNFVTPEIIASLEYGAAVLGTKVILVLGHTNCGAVKAAIQSKEVPGQISALYAHIQPAVDQAGPNPDAVTRKNALNQAELLSKSSTVIAGLLKDGKLKVVAGIYDVATGIVSLLS